MLESGLVEVAPIIMVNIELPAAELRDVSAH